MGTKTRGRGAAATFGLLLVVAGIAGAVALWLMAEGRPGQAVDGFARAPVGCTTTLEFSDTGTFFIYQEAVASTSDAFGECAPVATPGAEFGFELLADGRAVATRVDTSISYDTVEALGSSIARVEITSAGRYDLVVEGADPAVVAAVGRDPDLGVTELRRGAVAVGVGGLVLGGLMLVLAGRRSKRATSTPALAGPPPQVDHAPQGWPPEPPHLRAEPLVIPEAPTVGEAAEPLVIPEAPAVTPAAPVPEAAPASWAPPHAEERHDPPPST